MGWTYIEGFTVYVHTVKPVLRDHSPGRPFLGPQSVIYNVTQPVPRDHLRPYYIVLRLHFCSPLGWSHVTGLTVYCIMLLLMHVGMNNL